MTMTVAIKGVDREFVRRAKIAALGQGVTLREFIVNAIDAALQGLAQDSTGGRRLQGVKKSR